MTTKHKGLSPDEKARRDALVLAYLQARYPVSVTAVEVGAKALPGVVDPAARRMNATLAHVAAGPLKRLMARGLVAVYTRPKVPLWTVTVLGMP